MGIYFRMQTKKQHKLIKDFVKFKVNLQVMIIKNIHFICALIHMKLNIFKMGK